MQKETKRKRLESLHCHLLNVRRDIQNTNGQVFKELHVLGPYVRAAYISLNRVYLLPTVQVEKIGMHEVRLGLSGRPKRD